MADKKPTPAEVRAANGHLMRVPVRDGRGEIIDYQCPRCGVSI